MCWKWDQEEALGCNNGLQLPMAWGAPGGQGSQAHSTAPARSRTWGHQGQPWAPAWVQAQA